MEDDDFNFKISEAGGKIFITSEIRSIYYPRDTYMGLIKQYFGYGLWKVAVIKKHRRPARLSHLVPMMFVLYLMFGGLLSCFNKGIRKYYAGVLGLYTALDAGASFKLEVEDNPDSLMLRLRLMLIHFLLHVSYGCGFIVGILRFRHYPEGAQKACRRGQSVDKPV